MSFIQIRFRDTPGIADSEWIQIAPGIGVLTGRNNVGKSRLMIEISRLLDDMTNPGEATPEVHLREDDIDLSLDMRGHPPPTRFDLLRGGKKVEVRWEGQPNQPQFVVRDEGKNDERMGYAFVPTGIAQVGVPERDRLIRTFSRLVYLPPQRFIPATVPTTPVDVPAAQGADLGQAIYKHRNAMTPQFAEFEATVAEMIPEVSAVLTDPIASGQVTIKLRDRFARFDVPLDRAGTGVAQLLHLVATVLFLPTGRIMLVDEPQLHLHPGAEKLLARFIRRHAEHDYLFSTHSSVFINALKPDRAWLLSRDEAGTHVRSVFNESLAKSAVLAELGLEAGDIVLAEKILLVEGPSDESIYPILLRRLGWDLVRQNCSVLRLSGADTARPVRELVEGLARLLNLRILLIVGEKISVTRVFRTDTNDAGDAPTFNMFDDHVSSEHYERGHSGGPFFHVEGSLHRTEWFGPGKISVRVRGDREPLIGIAYRTSPDGASTSAEDLLKPPVRYLYFRPEVMREFLGRPSGSLSWFTRQTGQVEYRGQAVPFGVAENGLVNVVGSDIAELPASTQRIWLAHNVTPDGPVSAELLSAQMSTKPAATLAPEALLRDVLEKLDETWYRAFGTHLVKAPTGAEESIERACNRFQALNDHELSRLAKDLSRFFIERFDEACLKKIAPLPANARQDERRSLGLIEDILKSRNLNANSVSILRALNELRQDDSHIPASDRTRAVRQLGLNAGEPYPHRSARLITATLIALDQLTTELASLPAPAPCE